MQLELAEVPELDAQSQIHLRIVQMGTTQQVIVMNVSSVQQVQSVIVELKQTALLVHIL
jgi:hypothetical protein